MASRWPASPILPVSGPAIASHALRVDIADPSGVPIVKGVTTVLNATTDEVFGAIIPTGMRKLWDTRLESAGVLQRSVPGLPYQ